MQKIALYRKYRPENFDQVVGQQHIVLVLKNAIIQNKISHAYLFSGPRGTGKTSVARILAKTVNCNKKNNYNPCGKCGICVGITEGRIIDLIEIDAASNRGIDEIRDLREKSKFSPTEGDFKVFIIDEVHMLTKEAFNALLKTLEEPPKHAIFILATTEINKVPVTVMSRCQRHDFRRIKVSDIVGRLREVADKEKINISDEALFLIAEISDGGMRDALSVLDQISVTGKKKIETTDIEKVIGLTPIKKVEEYISHILAGKKMEAMALIEKIAASGMDLVNFTKSCLEYNRLILTAKIGGTDLVKGTQEFIAKIEKITAENDTEKLISVGEELLWAQTNFKTNVDPKIILTIVTAKDFMAGDFSEALPSETLQPKAIVAVNSPKQNRDTNGKWQHFLLEIKAKNNTIHAFLRVASPAFEDGQVTLTFPYKFHKEQIENDKNRRMVESVLLKVYGKPVSVKCALEGGMSARNTKIKDVESAATILGGEIID